MTLKVQDILKGTGRIENKTGCHFNMKITYLILLLTLNSTPVLSEDPTTPNPNKKEIYLIDRNSTGPDNPLFHAFQTKDPEIQKMILTSLAEGTQDENEIVRQMSQDALIQLQQRKRLEIK